MRNGELWRVNLDPTIGSELRKTRPVVVVNAGDSKSLELAIVVPVTGWQPRWEGNPFFVTLEPGPPHGLTKRSSADCFQIRTLSHQRFIEKIGELHDREQEAIKRSLALILDIEPEHCN